MSARLRTVAALYCEAGSVYNSLPFVDVYDQCRDARTYTGDSPVVAHPPCRLWSRMRAFSAAPVEEKDLAFHAIAQVRRCGGVLEHPVGSSLWSVAQLPAPGEGDAHGFATVVDQQWFGHLARKRTLLYVCGVDWWRVPQMPMTLGEAQCVVSGRGRQLPKRLRSSSPPDFARWLVAIARSARE